MKIILEIMGFLDLFLLSCTSAKTKKIVKHVFTIRKHSLFVEVGQPLLLQILSRTDQNYSEEIHLYYENDIVGNVFYVNIGTVDNVPSDYAEENDGTFTLSTYWSDPKTGFNVLYDALFEVFGAKVNEVTMDVMEISAENYQKEIDWVENLFPNLPKFGIIGICSFQDYIWLMKNIKAKNVVFFTMEPTEYPGNHEIVNLEMEEVNIRCGKWMKLQDIQAINARNIGLENISLTDNEINALLKSLKVSKEKSNMEKLILEFYRVADLEIVLEGLDVTNEDQMKPEDSLNQWSFKMANGEKCTVIYAEYDNDDSDDLMFGFEIQIGN
ncbi:unnamed protein product [Caenorhabditis brenneri]